MSEKRRDHKGRILKTGESQRKDLRYQYRYQTLAGKRETIYASDLNELREKEKEINKLIDEGIDYAAGNISVLELVKRYVSLKKGVEHNTEVGYNFVQNLIKKEDFAYRAIRSIKVSDVQRWIVKLSEDGKRYSTISSIRGVLKPAFQMAYNEDVLNKNPFNFRLTDVIANDSEKRVALTATEQDIWMTFIANDPTYQKYYDEFVVLLETGLRVSEFCGLTKSDLDFNKRKIRVDHQLLRKRNGTYIVVKTKTPAGCRDIPMSDTAYQSLKNIIANRPRLKTEVIIDGYSGFLLIDRYLSPKVALHIENEMRRALAKYHKLHPDTRLPHITPHVFRHTFCTNMASAGMNIKTLQYLMGHADVAITMNVYTHMNYDRAATEMAKIVDISHQADEQKKTG